MSRVLLLGVCLFLIALGRGDAQGNGPGWGTVKGRVVWAEKNLPKRLPLNIPAGPFAACLVNGPILSEDLLVHAKNRGVRYVFVSLVPINKGAKLPVHPSLANVPPTKVEMDQPCCMFVPRAVALREGQTLLVKNTSQMVHNFRYLGDQLNNAGGNVNIPAKGSIEITNLKAQRSPIIVNCDIHKWMSGAVAVFDHPYFAITDESGSFEIKNAPAGTWEIEFRHESGKWNAGDVKQSRVRVTVPAGKEATVNVDWKAPPP
jgi:hypothetical protein